MNIKHVILLSMIAYSLLNVGCGSNADWEEIRLEEDTRTSSSIAPPEEAVPEEPTYAFGPGGLGQLPGATAVVPGGGGLPGGSTGTGGTGTGGTGTGRPAGWNGTWGMREFVAHVHKFYWNGALSAGEIDALTAAGGTCRSIARNAMYSSRNPYRYNATQDESFNAAKVYLRVSYRALYQREADSAGFNSWFNYGKNVAENAEDGNAGITAVENGMLNSNEFKNVCAKSGLAY